MAKKQPLYPHVPNSKTERLPQTSNNNHQEEPMSLNLTREQVTETIIENLIQVGVLLRSEAGRYRGVLETYDNIALLKVLIHSHELKEA